MNLGGLGAVLALAALVAAGVPAQAEEAAAAAKIVASPVPADFKVPTLVETPKFRIVPLGPALVKVDFDAYMSSIEHLQTTFTRGKDWPHPGITDADAMRDMETEQARFQTRKSFAYAVLTSDGTRERGCVYVYPGIAGHDAVVQMWVTKAEHDAGFDAELYAWVQGWMRNDWPFRNVAYPGRAIPWDVWDVKVAANKAG